MWSLIGRLVILRQTRSWYGQEDTRLTARLMGELPGVLLWALEGWKRLQARAQQLSHGFVFNTKGRRREVMNEGLKSCRKKPARPSACGGRRGTSSYSLSVS